MLDPATASRLIDGAYAASLLDGGLEAWREVLDDLRTAVGADNGSLVIRVVDGPARVENITTRGPEFEGPYLAHYHGVEPYMLNVHELELGSAHLSRSVAPPAYLGKPERDRTRRRRRRWTHRLRRGFTRTGEAPPAGRG